MVTRWIGDQLEKLQWFTCRLGLKQWQRDWRGENLEGRVEKTYRIRWEIGIKVDKILACMTGWMVSPLTVIRNIEWIGRKGNSSVFASVKFEIPVGDPSIDTQWEVGNRVAEPQREFRTKCIDLRVLIQVETHVNKITLETVLCEGKTRVLKNQCASERVEIDRKGGAAKKQTHLHCQGY